MRIAGDDGHHRLADKSYLPVRQDWLIVEGGAIVWMRNELPDVIDRYDMKHARYVLRRARIDRLDQAVRDRAAEYLGNQHAGQAHVMDVFGTPGDLVAPFRARHRAADLGAGAGDRGRRLARSHQRPPLSFNAARTARRR